MIIPFILSQVGEEQNELVYSAYPIDKRELSEYIYSINGNFSSKPSFFRCFRMKHKIVLSYYWKSSNTEPKSSRAGLFVIIGFIIDDSMLKNCDSIVGYSKQLFLNLEKIFNVHISSELSDNFFDQLQVDCTEKISLLDKSLIATEICETKSKIRYLFLKKRVDRNVPKVIYCINETDFMAKWEIFSYLSLDYIKRRNWDISSINGVSPLGVQFMSVGDCFPCGLNKIALKNYNSYYFLLFS